MAEENKKCNCNNEPEVTYQPEKIIDTSKECDPNNPDYPWVSCGIDKDKKKENNNLLNSKVF